MTHQQVITPQWIDNIYVGPFWMGSPEEIALTQEAIDEEIRLYTGDDYDETTSTEIGETHYDRQ